jgi:transglutaminase-like putative cysteine protease
MPPIYSRVMQTVSSTVNLKPPLMLSRPPGFLARIAATAAPYSAGYAVRPLPSPVPPARQTTSLPAGDAGTAKTVGWMRKLIHQGSKSPEIREMAANLAMRHSTDQGKIGSIFEFVRSKMKYVRDPLHQEMLAGTDYHMGVMGREGYARGDCDDHTIMLGAMLESVGYPTRITTARMKPGPGSFDHVYLEVNDRTGWVPLDPSNKQREAGEEPPANRLRRW